MISTLHQALECAIRVSHRKPARTTASVTRSTVVHKNPNIKCNTCGEKGHISRNCPKRKVNEVDIQEISEVEEEDSGVEIDELSDYEDVEIEEKRARETEDIPEGIKRNRSEQTSATEGRKPDQVHTRIPV